MTIPVDLLLGRDNSVMALCDAVPVHQNIIAPLSQLKVAAKQQGFELRVVSGYRSFDRQMAIWNAKASGQRPVLDSTGKPLDLQALSAKQIVDAILRWSALPGASRHHWGSDIDVYDAAAVSGNYKVQLTPAEVDDKGVFGPMHKWLDQCFAAGEGFGFFRPYSVDRGGIAPERWHLSYAPLAQSCDTGHSPLLLREALLACPELSLREVVLQELDEIYGRYIAVPASCYPPQWRPVKPGGAV
jgi:LAS superfamily LD-carboxypeptidase LdcB